MRNGASARESLARGAPDVLLVDLGLPDVSGVDIIRETARRYPDTDIMVVTVFGDEGHVLASIEGGATGYLLKDSAARGVRRADQAASRRRLADQPGDRAADPQAGCGPRTALRRMTSGNGSELSPRESEVLSFIAKGFSFGEIGKLLDDLAAYGHDAREEDLSEARRALAG